MDERAPEDIIDLMAKCVGLMSLAYTEGHRLPYLVDLDKPELRGWIGEVILSVILAVEGGQHVDAGERADAILSVLRTTYEEPET